MDYSSEFVTSSLLLAVLFVALLYYYSTSTFDYWKDRGIKYIKPYPFIGNSKNLILRKVHRSHEFQEIYDQFEGERFVGIFQFRQPSLFVRDPKLAHSILTTDFVNFTDRGFFLNQKIDKLSGHLLSLSGSKWKNLRRKLTPVFSSGKLKNMMEELNRCTEELHTVLDEHGAAGDVIEVRSLMEKFTTRVIGSVAFGCEFDTLKDTNSDFTKRAQMLFKLSYRTIVAILLDVLNPNLRNILGIKSMSKDQEDFYLNFVKDTVTYREKNNISRNDFLQLLINLRKEDASEPSEYLQTSYSRNVSDDVNNDENIILDDKLLASNVFVFFTAGFETTASSLANCLLELAANPDCQRKLREEVSTALKNNNNRFSYNLVKEMSYLNKVVTETLRKYPIIFALSRKCTKAYRIPETDVVIDEGVLVTIPVYSIHTDPQYYPRPEVFDPERFAEENKHKRINGTYLPFGDGPRNCIGMRFALLEIKVAIAYMISRYQFTLTNKMAYPIEFYNRSVFIRPKDGIWLRIEKCAKL